MYNKQMLLVLLLTIVFVPVLASGSSYTTSGLSGIVIIYGTSSCPACSSLKQFFDTYGIPYEFREIYDCSSGSCSLTNYGKDLASILELTGLQPYIPDSIVIDRNGYITAVVQGSIQDKEFWIKLLNTTFKCQIPVYTQDQWGRTILANQLNTPTTIQNLTKIVLGIQIPQNTLNKLLQNCTPNTTPTTPPTHENTNQETKENNWLYITPAAIVLIITAITIIAKTKTQNTKHKK